MVVQGKSFGVSAVLLLVAIIIFVLVAFGVDVGSVKQLKLAAVGLAFFAASFLLP